MKTGTWTVRLSGWRLGIKDEKEIWSVSSSGT